MKKLIAILAFLIASSAFAKKPPIEGRDFKFPVTYDLNDYAGKMTFLEFMTTEVFPSLKNNALEKFAKKQPRVDNDSALKNGDGVLVKINDKNLTYHVNFKAPNEMNAERSGRSYGQGPQGRVSDPSDSFYLRELAKVVTEDDSELSQFYKTLIQIIGNCDASEYDKLKDPTQIVATDFIAIYIAEEDRHLMSDLGKFNWDDAIFEVTMLGALHGGQSKMTMFYQGEFTEDVFDQDDNTKKRPATMVDYWQISTNDPNRSGINLTRTEFEKMGQWVTTYERTSKHKNLLSAVENDIGASESKNIFKEITAFFISKSAPKNMSRDINKLSDDIAALLVQVHEDADEITSYVKKNAK